MQTISHNKRVEYLSNLYSYDLDEFIEMTSSLKRKDRDFVTKVLMPPKMLPILLQMRYKFIWGGRGGSKTYTVCKEMLNEGDVRKIRVIFAREFQNSIKDSVHAELKEMISELGYMNYRVTENSIVNERTGTEFVFIGLWGQDKKQSIKSFANADYCIVEEAQTVSEGSLKILLPTIRKEGSEIWFLFNRMLPDDPVWILKERINQSRKIEINVNYDDNPFLSKTLKAEHDNDLEAYKAGKNDEYMHVWRGDPYAYSDRTIFKTSQIQDAMERQVEMEGQTYVGVDVARFGKDRTVFIMRHGLQVVDYKIIDKASILENKMFLIDFIDNDTSVILNIDDTGVGGGLTDIMKPDGFKVNPINFGQRAHDADKYNNAISEMWFELRRKIDEVGLLEIPGLKQELLTREFKMNNKGQRVVESKEEYKKRGFRSPDIADALLLCFYDNESESIYDLGNVI